MSRCGMLSCAIYLKLRQFPHNNLLFVTANDNDGEYYMVQVTSGDECWLLQRNLENFKMLDEQLHQCIYDRKRSQLPELSSHYVGDGDIEVKLYHSNFHTNNFDRKLLVEHLKTRKTQYNVLYYVSQIYLTLVR